MKFFTEIFRKNLSYLLKSRGITQTEVANALDITDQAVSGWMKVDGNTPSRKNVTRLAIFFDVSENDLVSIDLENSGIVRDGGEAYGNDKIALALKRQNLQLEEFISNNNQIINRLLGK